VVVSVNVLYALAGPERYLRQVHGLLNPGGVLVLSNPHVADPSSVFPAHQDWLERHATDDERTADEQIVWDREVTEEMNRRIAHYAQKRQLHFITPLNLLRLLYAAGFRTNYVNPKAYAGVNVTIRAIAK
jgi:SAM-dependent methyltransferase